MSTSAEPAPEARRRQVSTTGLALALAVALVAIVALLNLLERPTVPVSAEKLEALLEGGMVSEVLIDGNTLWCRLSRQVRFREEALEAERVAVRLPGPPTPDQVARWRTQAAEVRFGAAASAPHPWLWPGIVSLLLGGGIWHLVSQGRRHRAGGGPRQRLLEAERELRAGRISQQQYEELVSALTIEL